MVKFTKKNRYNIQHIVEAKTGLDLSSSSQKNAVSVRKMIVVTAIIVLCSMLAAFTYPLFSPLNGDMLSLSGEYQGDGIVTIHVVNGSEKTLKFQKQLKLISWKTGEVKPLSGKIRFENTVFEPHSSGVMTVDLSLAYPMEEIENTASANSYYLLLTNQDFLFGQDWICSILMKNNMQVQETKSKEGSLPIRNIEGVEESLLFYFQDHYLDEVPAWNPQNGEYMQKVQDLLRKRKGTLVHSVDPLLLLEVPEEITGEGLPVMQNHFTLDSFKRMVSSMFPGNGQDCALTIGVPIPQYKGQKDGGNGGFYIRYFFTYPKVEVQQEDAYTFLYGRILDFTSMKPHQVYEDEVYIVYDMTHLFFTDLDDYIDDFLDAFGGDIYMDEDIRKQIRAVYDYCGDRERLDFYYVIDPRIQE